MRLNAPFKCPVQELSKKVLITMIERILVELPHWEWYRSAVNYLIYATIECHFCSSAYPQIAASSGSKAVSVALLATRHGRLETSTRVLQASKLRYKVTCI